jgi:hypothetical protein
LPLDTVLTLTNGEQTGDIGHLVIIDPHAAHGIVNARKYPHRMFARVFTDEFLVNLQDSPQLPIQEIDRKVGKVQIDLILAVNAELLVDADMEDLRVAMSRGTRFASRIFSKNTRLAVLIRPDAPPSPRRIRTSAQLGLLIAVDALNKFAIGVATHGRGSSSGTGIDGGMVDLPKCPGPPVAIITASPRKI